MKDKIKILAIETSCDETAAAVITAAPPRIYKSDETTNNSQNKSKEQDFSRPTSYVLCPTVLSNIVSSQIDLHKKTNGVVPEVASRAHLESIIPVINEAFDSANIRLNQLTHIAVTAGPGLIGSLMVGFDTAKSLAYGLDIPIVPINHIEGHLYSALLNTANSAKQTKNSNLTIQWFNNEQDFPLLALMVSGGHTSLILMHDHGKYETLGETLDDAAGEAFDKVAKLLDLGYPGGPVVSKLAEQFRNKNKILNIKNKRSSDILPKELRPNAYSLSLPRPMLDKPGYDFSFSGLKTAVLTEVKRRLKNKKELSSAEKEEICFAFEEAVVDVLVGKTLKAAKKYKPKSVILAGGVSANKRLQEVMLKNMSENGFRLLLPPKDMTGDNAAMIGLAAYYHIIRGNISSWDEAKIDSNMSLK